MSSKATAATTRADAVIRQLKALESPKDREGMTRFGIRTDRALGISIYTLRDIAKALGTDHELALALWATGIHEARHLACQIDDPARVTPAQMDAWAADFDSWDLCDQCCSNLFDQTPFAYEKAFQYVDDEREFVRRTGFVLMACLAVHDKKAGDEAFEQFFPAILAGAADDRNFVRKAVNWALRQIGKRNLELNRRAVEVAREVQAQGTRSARWIAADALRELESPRVRQRLEERARKGTVARNGKR